MASNVSPDRSVFRQRARTNENARLIKSYTLDDRPGTPNIHRCAMAELDDGFYIEGGLRLPKDMVIAVREHLSVNPLLPTYFIDEDWFSYSRLQASFDRVEKLVINSGSWDVVEHEVLRQPEGAA